MLYIIFLFIYVIVYFLREKKLGWRDGALDQNRKYHKAQIVLIKKLHLNFEKY